MSMRAKALISFPIPGHWIWQSGFSSSPYLWHQFSQKVIHETGKTHYCTTVLWCALIMSNSQKATGNAPKSEGRSCIWAPATFHLPISLSEYGSILTTVGDVIAHVVLVWPFAHRATSYEKWHSIHSEYPQFSPGAVPTPEPPRSEFWTAGPTKSLPFILLHISALPAGAVMTWKGRDLQGVI